MRKQLTAEQTAERDARRAKFRDLVKQVAAMDDGQRAAIVNSFNAVVTCEGRALSVKNTCLLFLQTGGAVSMVGGFRQWIRQGRCVMKGQRGLSIWIPCGAKAEDGTAEGDGGPRFIVGTVFDITQTADISEGEPVAVVSPEVAEAFGMASLPNVRETVTTTTEEERSESERFEPTETAAPVVEGFINTAAARELALT